MIGTRCLEIVEAVALLERNVTQIAVIAKVSNNYASLHSRGSTMRLDQNELGTNGRTIDVTIICFCVCLWFLYEFETVARLDC